jgi:hypothetical protein
MREQEQHLLKLISEAVAGGDFDAAEALKASLHKAGIDHTKYSISNVARDTSTPMGRYVHPVLGAPHHVYVETKGGVGTEHSVKIHKALNDNGYRTSRQHESYHGDDNKINLWVFNTKK